MSEEINELMATEVMGLEWVPYWTTIKVEFKGTGDKTLDKLLKSLRENYKKEHEDGDESWCWAKDGNQLYPEWDPEDPTAIWNPTWNMNQAMECVEKMLSDSYNFWLDKNRTTNPSKRHEYKACFQNSRGQTVCIIHKSPSLAICKAILDAKGVPN